MKIVLVDDHCAIRAGLERLIHAQSGWEVITSIGDGDQALRALAALAHANTLPDLVILDIALPGWSGVEVTQVLSQQMPSVPVLVLTTKDEWHFLRVMLEAGAAGYALKRSPTAELVQAMRRVADGKMYLDPWLAEHLRQPLQQVLGLYIGQSARSGSAESRRTVASDIAMTALRDAVLQSALSKQENIVVRQLALGYSGKEIAAMMGISTKTVETYRARAGEKLAVTSRADLVRYAIAKGWLRHGG